MVNRKGIGICIIVVALCMPAYADRGNGAYRQGVRAEHASKYDDAFKFYKEANEKTPNNPKYFIAYSRMRLKASSEHIQKGQLLRNTGALQEAQAEFQHAVDIDGTNFMAQQELRLTAEMIRQKEKPSSTPKVESPLSKLTVPTAESVELQPVSTGPITFKMTGNADVVYRTLCKLAGINVLFDPDYRAPKVNIELNNVTLLQALDMLRLQSKSYWRPVSSNTIFVATDSPTVRKELEQNFMKTFYLQNVTTATDLQEAASVVSKLLDVNRVQLLQAQDALVVRGTMDQMVLVQKLLNDIDKPKSEVIIDVAVMEVSRSRIRTLGSTLPTTESVSYLPGGAASAGSSSGAITSGNFSFSLPSGSFTALASESNGKVLQNPEIRVLNDEKATLRIGDRVPIATGSFASGLVGGGSVSPLISTQFQYLDVGVNIDITPHIHGNHEVTLKMSLEISTVAGEVNIGGITQPEIGQRRIEHEARLADGEVNVLGGIIEDTENQSLSGYPWLIKIPILKYLFAQENKDREQNEIIFAITPHIVRAPEITEDNLRLIEVGNGNSTELPHRQSNPAVSATGQPAAPGSPKPASPPTPPAGAPAPAPSGPATPPQANLQNKPRALP